MLVRSALAIAAVAASLAAAGPASADALDAAQDNQQHRIREGLRSGQLTRQEAARLEGEQDRIDHMIRRARMDGRVDGFERSEIVRAQEVASRHIFAEKHDAEARPQERHHRRWWHRWNRWN